MTIGDDELREISHNFPAARRASGTSWDAHLSAGSPEMLVDGGWAGPPLDRRRPLIVRMAGIRTGPIPRDCQEN